MPKDDDLLKYYIKHTDEKLVTIEKKLDKLLAFHWKVIGIGMGVSFIVSLLFEAAKAIAGG